MKEVLLTTCEDDQKLSVTCLDYNSSSKLQTYNNGGTAAAKTLVQIGNDYILTAEANKPLLHVWPANSQDEVKSARFVLPEPALALDVSSDAAYLAVGIKNKLYLWQLASGELLSVQQKHYQDITCLKFSPDCDYLVVCGQDGMLVTYNCGHLICNGSSYLAQSTIGQVDSLYTKLDHSMAIRDVFVGSFSATARVASVSSDHTCRVYTLHSGDPLLTLIFDAPLTAVLIDPICWNLFVGATTGQIEQFSFQNPPRTLQHYLSEDKVRLNFKGHQKKVNCLDMNTSCDNLLSASDDHFVFVWEIKSRQILRKIEHKGAVLNMKFTTNHKLEWKSLKPDVVIRPLKRNLDLNLSEVVVSCIQNKSVKFDKDIDVDESADFTGNLKAQLETCQENNKQLYELLVDML